MNYHFEKTVRIAAPPEAVWAALTRPELMLRWMGEPELDLRVATDWQVGGPFTVRGFHHVGFENRGTVLQYEPCRALAYTQLSSVSRLADRPEHYTTLRFRLRPLPDGTDLTLTIEGFPTEPIYRHLAFYWRTTLEKIRMQVEGAPAVGGQEQKR